jgi:hypothetical protein
MERGPTFKLVGALILLGVAGWMIWRFLADDGGVSGKAYFYDLSERRLFTGPRDAVPPIKGVNDAEADAVRAVVISTNGVATDRSARRIAYLEKYSPDLKREMEAAQASGTSPQMGRALAQAHRFVRRVDDPQWHPLTSEEAERIVNEWLTAGPDGGPAVICTP